MKFTNTFWSTVGLMLLHVTGFGQAALNTNLLGHLAYNEDLSEVRGAYHNGHEYALVGAHNGLSIVDVTDPTQPTEVSYINGPASIWRDPFYYNDHAYCVTEGGGGLVIVDMSPLPGSTTLSSTVYTGQNMPWTKAHNMFIDSVAHKAYIFGSDYGAGGAIILDVSDPENPVELGVWDAHYIHDGFVRGDTLWAACLDAGTFVVDVSNPGNPVELAQWETPSQFSHNVWPSDDDGHCFTTDEVGSGFVAAYDMSNLQNVQESDKVRHPLTEGVIPHNVHYFNGYLVISYYRDGMVIYDASDPSNIILTGYYDTSPFSGNGFNGAWGAWPYLPSGNILASDIEEGLFVVGPTYKRAARLQGNVTEVGSGNPLSGVQVEVASAGLSETTDLFGDYATGTEPAGIYTVTFQKGGYLPVTVNNVQLVNGQTVTLNVEMQPDVPFVLSGNVTEAGTGNPITDASVQLVGQFLDVELTTDSTGVYTVDTIYQGEYEVAVGAWGYHDQCFTLNIDSLSSPPDFELQPGYYDDFSLDLGWEVSGTASMGIWERAEPIGTFYNGLESNPGEDVDGDCGRMAFVTGNGGGSAGNDDVDDGSTILSSPIMDLSGMSHAYLRFKYWFYNDGGNTTPNDEMVLMILDGNLSGYSVFLPVTNSSWTEFVVPIHEQMALTSNMRVRLVVQDVDPGNLVEGGIDDFEILDATAVEEMADGADFVLFPNPASEFSTILINGNFTKAELRILDTAGRTVKQITRLNAGFNTVELPAAAGVYLCEVSVDGVRQVKRLIVQ